MKMRFRNRTEAGQKLAQELGVYKNRDQTLVLALPRGGVPVAFEIAKKLNLPLDICVIRKLGVPENPELAMGAIGFGGVRIINTDVINSWQVSPAIIKQVTQQQTQELHRRQEVYRGDRPFPKIHNQTIILVDDGIATGSTMQAAITIIKRHNPKTIIVAVPIAPPSVYDQLTHQVEQVVCLQIPDNLNSISAWYEDFSQTSDQQVCSLLFLAQHHSLTI